MHPECRAMDRQDETPRYAAGMRRAFTLIELLVVISVIAILVALLAGGMVTVREHARVVQARALIPMLDQALAVYRGEDLLRRFPAQPASGWIAFVEPGQPPQLGDLLAGVGFSAAGSRQRVAGIADPVVVDPWAAPVEYRLDADLDGTAERPRDPEGIAVQVPGDVDDWNPRGREPFAYVWSWGRPVAGYRGHDHARDWIHSHQDPQQP